MPSLHRRFTGFRVWVPICGLFLLWLLSAPERTRAVRLLSLVILTVIDCAAALAMGRAGRRQDLPGGFRTGVRWIACGMGLAGAGGVCLLADVLLDPGSKSVFNLSDLFFLSTYPALLFGLICMPRAERYSVSLGRVIIDSAVFLVGAGLPLWFFAVSPGLETASGYSAVLVVVYPLVTFTGILVLNLVVLTRMPLPTSGAFRLLVAGIAASWLADLVFLLDSVHGFIARSPVNWVNVLNASSLVLLLLAAEGIESGTRPKSTAAQPAASSPLPMITIVVVSAWLLIFVVLDHPAPGTMSRIVLSLTLLFVILSAREAFVYRDSLRWMAAEVHRESRAHFEALVSHSSDVIMVVDSTKVIRFASPAVAASFGEAAEAVVGRPLLDLAHPDDLARGLEFLETLFGSPRSVQSIQWQLLHSDKSYRHFETVGSNVEDATVGGLVINLRDITDRIALEQQLRHAQKLDAIGRLVGGIAHSFNNILTSTMMRLSVLRKNRRLPAEVISEIAALDEEARRSADLTKKLVLFGQQQYLQKKRIDLRESVASHQREIVQILGKDIQLYITGGSNPEWVDADPAMVAQVIFNLSSNARDAMPDGGCLIIEVAGVDAAFIPVEADAEIRPGAAVRLSFQDTGRGMDSSIRQRLFEPFFTTKGVGVGMGMGLAAVHGIVKQHRGWMAVESAPGLGSTFRIFLPRAPESGPA